MLLLSVFGLALLGLVGSFAVYVVLRFSIAGEHSAVYALMGWVASLVGTSLLIIQVVTHWVSVS